MPPIIGGILNLVKIMYDPKTLQTVFQSLVGVRQSNTPGVPLILPPLSLSTTGKYVDDKNPLASTENMYYSAPNFDVNVYPNWSTGSNYPSGSIVSSIGIIYIANNNLTNDTMPPASDTINWSVYNPFNNWISQKVNQAIPNLFDEIFKRKKLLHMGKAILERIQLFRGGGNSNTPIVGKGRFVGFSIVPEQAEALWVYLDKVGLQASGANPSMAFYLYHSEQDDYIYKWTLNMGGARTFNWTSLLDNSSPPKENCIMKYLSQNTSGTYYFGYYENDLVGNAYSRNFDCSTSPCPGCDGQDVRLYNQWSRYTTLKNIQVPSTALMSDKSLFDTSKITYGERTNWGINLSLTVRCNLTDFISYNPSLYSEAIAMQTCKEFLEAIANGIRLGPSPAQTKLSAISALDPKAPGNWISSYNDSIEALNIDLSGFSKSCMPCEENKKARFFSM